MHSLRALLLALVLVPACVMGKPLGFGDGESWTIPVVGDLEGGTLVAPVYIHGKGPFLFEIDPTQHRSRIDRRLAGMLGIHMERHLGDQKRDADDRTHEHAIYAEILKIQIGDLHVRSRLFGVFDRGQWSFRGHPILGELGRDIIDDTLVWRFDRDRMVLQLAVQGKLDPPPAGTAIKGKVDRSKFFVWADVGAGSKVKLYLNFRNEISALWPHVAKELGLQRTDAGAYMLDEWGNRRELRQGWRVDRLALGDESAEGFTFVPYHDARVDPRDWDGSLGLDFLGRYNLTVNWHEKRIWLEPRAAVANHATERLRRWGHAFDQCDSSSCVIVARSDDGTITVTRGPDAPSGSFDVLIQALDERGEPLHAPLLFAALHEGLDRAVLKHPGAVSWYAGAHSFRALDGSPFPPPCDDGACVWIVR